MSGGFEKNFTSQRITQGPSQLVPERKKAYAATNLMEAKTEASAKPLPMHPETEKGLVANR
jgi:hypothetical protein